MKLVNGLLYELKEISKRSVYFLISFSLILLVFKLFLENYSIHLFIIPKILVGAFLAAKTVLIEEQIGINRRLTRNRRPPYISVLFKTFLYSLIAISFLCLEALIRGLISSKSLARALEVVVEEKFNYQFLGVIVLLFIVFLNFNILEEINLYVGKGKLKKFFFTRPRSD